MRKAMGRLSVELHDDNAVVEMDGAPLGRGGWEGDVPAGEHVLSVYKPGHTSISTQIVVQPGEQMDLVLAVGPEQSGITYTPDYDVAELPYRQGLKQLSSDTGWYGSVTASHLLVLRSPDGFVPNSGLDRSGGGCFGVRAGYRLYSFLGLEAMYEGGSHGVSGRISDMQQTYDLVAHRAGANVRFYAGGSAIRFTAAFGAGIVWHRLDLAGKRYSGANDYFGLDLGPQINAGPLLLDIVFQFYLDGSHAARDGQADHEPNKTRRSGGLPHADDRGVRLGKAGHD